MAVLSYVNVVQGTKNSVSILEAQEFTAELPAGRSIALGAIDWIVWAPALALFILGAGLASLAPVGGVAVWIGLIVWLTVVTAVGELAPNCSHRAREAANPYLSSHAVSICFGRLLVAILRVRKTTRMEEKSSPWGREQERVVGKKGSSAMRTLASYLPPYHLPYHSNFSSLSTSFIGTIGRSTSTLDLSVTSHDVLPYTSSNAPGVGYAPSSRRPSIDSDQSTLRDVRSPTPGSTMGLLAGLRQSISNSRATTPIPSPRFSVGSQDHEIITFEEVELEPRPSMGSFASASTFNAGGFVGGTAMRQAIVQEVWGSSPAPGTGHSPKVELSKKEARGAMVRIGGHLFGCLLGYVSVSGLYHLLPC